MIEKTNFLEKMKTLNPSVNQNLLGSAWTYSWEKHQSQTRASGEAYFNHPLEVADILAQMRMDSATIATALLHDTIEDTTATRKEIAQLFGEEVAVLVEGVTKFTKLENHPVADKQAENFKKLLLATAGDVRVLLVKLADRLHNMRTLEHVQDEKKRHRIADETLLFYAPLAGRIGMQQAREELEDLSFRHLHPRAYKSLRSRLRPLVSEHSAVLHNIADELTRKFQQFGIEAEVSWRMKKPWAIWKKMERRSISLEQIGDLMGFRIIVPQLEECYRVLGIVHTTWHSVPKRFKDYISTPKPNGYQSIHSTIIGPKQQRIDLQIRTKLMHENAEYGIAAHWHYKEKDGDKPLSSMGEQNNWLADVVALIEERSTDAQDFMEHTKMEISAGYIFCFSKGGRLIVLPQESTPLDFAYAVHTDIGDSYAGAYLNGHQVTMRHVLQDGDEVEIARDKNAHPEPSWQGVVKTSKAHSAIRRSLRQQKKQNNQKLGWEILSSIFRVRHEKLSKVLLERTLVVLELENVEDVLEQVGLGKIAGGEVLDIVHPQKRARRWLPQVLFGRRRTGATGLLKKIEVSLPIKGNPSGIGMKFARQHFPIPGDKIIGVLTEKEGMLIYPWGARALSAFEKTPARWINLAWDIENKNEVFLSRLVLQFAHEIGALATITILIAEYGSNIDYLELIRSDNNFRTMNLDIEVRDIQHAREIIMALQGLHIVHNVRRETEPLVSK